MSIHDAFVQHGNNNRRVTRTFLPCFRTTDITSCFRTILQFILIIKCINSAVDIMPLIRQTGIIEYAFCFPRTRSCLLFQSAFANISAIGLFLVSTLNAAVCLYFGNFAQLTEPAGCFFHIRIFIKLHPIPQMQSCGAGPFFISGIYRKYTFKMISPQNSQHLVGRRNPGTGHSSPASGSNRKSPVKDLRHCRVELYQQFTGSDIRRKLDFRPPCRGGRLFNQFLFRAGSQRQGKQCCI